MASSPSNAGGIIIMSQVTSQNPTRVTGAESKKEPSNALLSKFFKGQPEVLGVIEIFTGLLQISLGFSFYFSCQKCYVLHTVNNTAVILWTGLLNIISGSISVAASNKPMKKMMKTSLIINTINSVASGIALIIYAFFFVDASYWYSNYSSSSRHEYCSYSKSGDKCEGNFNLKVVIVGTVSIFLICTLLQLCSSVSMSIFGCKVLCRTNTSNMSVIIYQNTSMNAGDVTTAATTMLASNAQ